jgi:hypothetical protein
MKNLFLILSLFGLVACSSDETYGDGDFNTSEAMAAADLMTMLEAQDTVEAVVSGQVSSVCQAKGCWMQMDMNETPLRVTFKDYGFFVPMNSAERNVYVKGKAFIKETSVEMLKEYARDAEKSEEEIAAITSPKTQYAFVAEGVIFEE